MLPKTKRLTAKDFKGLRPRLLYRGNSFDVSGAEAETPKFACVISKKRIKRAVDRNKARRKIYAALSSLPYPKPFTYIIYPTKTVLTLPLREIKEECKKAFATL